MRRKQWELPPLGLVGLFLGFAMAIALIPYTVTTALIYHHRMRKAAKSFTCSSCAQRLGIKALQLPEKVRDEFHSDRVARKDFARGDLLDSVDAVCPHCRAFYHFDYSRRTFLTVALAPPAVRD